MKRYLTTAALLLAGALFTCSHAMAADPGITDTEIVIGDVEPLTGPPALLGVAASIGHKIPIAEANNPGGINGRKIQNRPEDDGYVTPPPIQGVKKGIFVFQHVFDLSAVDSAGLVGFRNPDSLVQ